MDELAEARLDAANHKLVAYAEARFPSVFKTSQSDRSLKFVAKVRTLAAAHGITREDNVANYLDLVTMYGLDFDQAPWAAGVLSNAKLHGPDKIAILKRRLAKRGIQI